MSSKKTQNHLHLTNQKHINMLVILLCLVLVGTSVYVLATGNKARDTVIEPQLQIEEVPLPPKVYTNKKYGYTLSYPAEWKLSVDETKKATFIDPATKHAVKVEALDNPMRLNAKEYIKQEVEKTFTISNQKHAKLEKQVAVITERVHKNRDVKTGAMYIERGDRFLNVSWSKSIGSVAQDIVTSIKLRRASANPVADERIKVVPSTQQNYEVPVVDTSGYRVFSGVDFKNLYYSIVLPGTTKITTPPAITGDTAADARIRSLATARGYQLQASPNVGLSSADGYPLHATVAGAWAQLQQAATADGIGLSIISGYRSVDDQRNIFLGRLAGYGNYSHKQIANGAADTAINQILITSSIPGYSKHHTGYTIDIQTNGTYFESFGSTAGFAWISANNYYNAKRFGFIPSYPSGAGLQGPDPEAWEYVYVGTSYLQN